MALSSAERQKRRREKLREEGRYDDYRKCQNLFAKKNRDKLKEIEKQLSKTKQKQLQKERREKVKIRVAKCRALKKEKQNVVTEKDPKSDNVKTLDMTTVQIKQALQNLLPRNLKKKRAVLLKLFQSEVQEATKKGQHSKVD